MGREYASARADDKSDDEMEMTWKTNPNNHMDTDMYVNKTTNIGKGKLASGESAQTNINLHSSEAFNGFAEPDKYSSDDEEKPYHIKKDENKTMGIEGEDGYCEEINEHCECEVKKIKPVATLDPHENSAKGDSDTSNIALQPTMFAKRTNLNEYFQHQLRYADQAKPKYNQFRKQSGSPSVSIYKCHPSSLLKHPALYNSSEETKKLFAGAAATFQETNSILQVATDAFSHQTNSNVIATEDGIDFSELSVKGLLLKILENQAKQATVLDYVVKMQEQVMQKLVTRSQTKTSKTFMNPIDTVEDCHRFEKNLKNEDFSQEMIKTLESVCSADCGMCGDNVAYTFVDVLFTRRFFTLVTWTGLSRSTESKECFQKFEIIFRFFFDQVKRIDSKYTIKSMKDFFQKLISNSKRRFHQTKMRTSRVKYRKAITTKKRKKSPVIKIESLEQTNVKVDDDIKLISTDIAYDENGVSKFRSNYSESTN